MVGWLFSKLVKIMLNTVIGSHSTTHHRWVEQLDFNSNFYRGLAGAGPIPSCFFTLFPISNHSVEDGEHGRRWPYARICMVDKPTGSSVTWLIMEFLIFLYISIYSSSPLTNVSVPATWTFALQKHTVQYAGGSQSQMLSASCWPFDI